MELLASRLKKKHLLVKGITITFYRDRDAEFVPFFDENMDLVHYNDVESILQLGIHKYNPDEWKLFIDSSNVV